MKTVKADVIKKTLKHSTERKSFSNSENVSLFIIFIWCKFPVEFVSRPEVMECHKLKNIRVENKQYN